MLFMITYAFGPGHREKAQERFKKTGGGPPAGAKPVVNDEDVLKVLGA